MREYSTGVPFAKLTQSGLAAEPLFAVVATPTGEPLRPGIEYEFVITAVRLATALESAASNSIRLRYTGAVLPKPRSPVVLLHGFISSSDTWNTLKAHLISLGWGFGGELSYDAGQVTLAGGTAPAQADFFTATLPSCVPTTRICGLSSLQSQGEIIALFLDALKERFSDANLRFTLVAHSNGGLAARSYITNSLYASRRDIDNLVIYGSPNLGAQVAKLMDIFNEPEFTPCGEFITALRFSGSIFTGDPSVVIDAVVKDALWDFVLRLAAEATAPAMVEALPGSAFLTALNTMSVPLDIRYTRLIGSPPSAARIFGELTDLAVSAGCVAATEAFADLRDSDGIVAKYSQVGVLGNVNVFPPSVRRSFVTQAYHWQETQDIPNILQALTPGRSLQVTVLSPVVVEVRAPDGLLISESFNEIPGSAYKVFFDSSGHQVSVITIPFPIEGVYNIRVIPRPTALPTDTYSIELFDGEDVVVLAQDLPIASTPEMGFDILVDTTDPQVICDTADNVWHANDVSLSCASSDSGSGLAVAMDAQFTLATSVAVGTETSDAQSDSRLVCDRAGNCALAGPIGGNRVDKRSPDVTISVPTNAAYAFGQLLTAGYTCTDGASGIASCTGPVASGAYIDTSSLGPKTFTVNARDNVGNASSLSVEYTVVAVPTVSMVTVTPNLQQYSDLGTFTATLSPAALLGQAPAATVTFMVGSQTLGTVPLTQVNGTLTGTLANIRLREPTPFGTAPTDQMAPGSHTVTAVFGGVNPNFTVNDATTTLTIAKEDAVATYTGAVFASTACVTCNTATVTLSATVQDISAVPTDPATDGQEGDIRHATVTFAIVETGQTFPGVPVGLVTTADTRTGTATKNVAVNIGNADALALTVRVIVDGYYTGLVEQSVLNVAKPLSSSFITGGGYLLMSQSAGLYPGQVGTKNNFGFSVKYNKSGTNLQGNINTLVRNNGRVYQIKGNAMTSLSTNPAAGTATFNGKANIQDVTNPLNPVSIDGNATLQVTMTDRGEPGAADGIGVTVWNKSGGLWFSSNWNGTRTQEQTLAGGNVVVR